MKPARTLYPDGLQRLLTDEEVAQLCGWPDSTAFPEQWLWDAARAGQAVVQAQVRFRIGSGAVRDLWRKWPDDGLELSCFRPGQTIGAASFDGLAVSYRDQDGASVALASSQWLLDVTGGDGVVRLLNGGPKLSSKHGFPVVAAYSWVDNMGHAGVRAALSMATRRYFEARSAGVDVDVRALQAEIAMSLTGL